MKLSIIVGVIHMCLGILMKGVNAWYFRKPLDFIFEFIPQLTFMLVTFGYMCTAIVVKWLQNWGDGSGAPSIISIFINIGAANETTGILWGNSTGEEQTVFQQRLFLIAFICVLLMLIPKPLILTLQITFKKKKETAKVEEFEEISDEEDVDEIHENLLNSNENKSTQSHEEHHEEHSVGEIWVDQLIEIIEFVLGSISNTASYLRLWALSLAHGQLAKVFLTMTLMPGIASGNILITLIGFPVFLVCTFGVLIVMDAMECFLHTLRLHWVEFQNKFFKGDGIAFKAFSLNLTVADEFQKQIDQQEDQG
jgi:V-type H+-transporting ATPase subunit a